MTQTPNDQISAFFDNEIDDAESDLVLRRLTRDQELRDCLARYALIGEAVRRDQPAACNIAERVREVLNSEPAISGPAAAKPPGLRRYLRPLVGAAIAATVAVVAIGNLSNSPTAPATATVAVSQGSPLSPGGIAMTPVSSQASAESYTVPAVIPAGRQSMEARRQLNSYLVSHSQYAKRMGPQNIVSFRAVGYQGGTVPPTTDNNAGAEPRQ